MALVRGNEIREALLRARRKSWFSNGILGLALGWWVWNWFAPSSLRFDDHTLSLLVFLYSVEASWAAALIYQQTSRNDEILQRSLADDAQRVKEILAMMREISSDVETLADEVRDGSETEV